MGQGVKGAFSLILCEVEGTRKGRKTLLDLHVGLPKDFRFLFVFFWNSAGVGLRALRRKWEGVGKRTLADLWIRPPALPLNEQRRRGAEAPRRLCAELVRPYRISDRA